MSEFLRIVAALQQHMNATFSRSDVLRPLHIMLGTLVFLMLGLAYTGDKVPSWLIAYAAYGIITTVVLQAFAYLFCLFIDRDSLKSEKYQLQKLAIETRMLGDERTGLIEVEQQPVDSRSSASPKVIAVQAEIPLIEPATKRKTSARSTRSSGRGDE